MTTPSYATVTLVCAEDAIPSAASSSSLCKTMRVPVDARTTVRELAKAAMTRFVHSLRRTASSSDLLTRQLCRSGIIVTDVHLRAFGGDAATTAAMSAATAQTSVLSSASSQSSLTRCGSPLTPSKIELFSDDCVTQVVQVREEVVYMTFRAASEHRSKKKPAEPAAESKGVSDVQASSVPQADRASAQPAENAVPPAVTPFDVTRMLAEHSTTTGHITEEEVFCSGPEDLGKDGISMSVPVPARVDALPIKAADKSEFLSPHNQSTLPPDSALPHTTRSKAVRPSSPSLALSSTSDSSSNNGSDSDDDDDAEEEEAISIARSIATLRQAETRRMPWGPDAHKHFATNYVNSPHKILRGRYNAKRQLPPPPPVKLNATEKAPRSASSTGAKASSASGSERPECSAKSGAKRSAERVATPSPSRKMKRTESLSSSEHSQVSVTMSCGASSESPSPHRRAASGTRSQLFSPGHGTTTVTQVAAAVASVDKEPESLMTVHEAQAQAAVAPPPPLPSPPSPAAAVSDTQTGAVINASATPLEKMTPSEAVSQAEPSTIAKPVQSFAVRQLSFEDNSGHDASKAPSLLTSPVAPPVPAVQVVSVEHRLPPPVL